MPRKPKQPCVYPGCTLLSDSRYCEKHRKLVERNYDRYTRDRSVRRKYNGAWRKIRAGYAKAHPFCEQCYREGRMTEMAEVHHIKPLSIGGTHEEDNLMSLCRSCHNKAHYTLGDRRVRR